MNRNPRISLMCLLLVALSNSALAETHLLTQLIAKIQPAVVTIKTYNWKEEPSGQATGFFINSNTLITNYHVLKGAYKAEIITHDGMNYPITRVIADNRKMDLVKLLVEIPRNSVSHVDLAKSLPSIAEHIFVLLSNPSFSFQ